MKFFNYFGIVVFYILEVVPIVLTLVLEKHCHTFTSTTSLILIVVFYILEVVFFFPLVPPLVLEKHCHTFTSTTSLYHINLNLILIRFLQYGKLNAIVECLLFSCLM